MFHPHNAIDCTEEEWDATVDSSLKGAWLMSKYSLPTMIAQGRGVIIHQASGWGIQGGDDAVAYCAAKGGLVVMTKAMAIDHGKQGIRVNCICPGDVDTPMLAVDAEARRMSYADYMKGRRQSPARPCRHALGTGARGALSRLGRLVVHDRRGAGRGRRRHRGLVRGRTMKGLTGKRVVITGGASGIGAATVERFLEEGARVAVIDRDEAGGRALAQKHPDLAGVIHADVADAAAVESAFRELDALLGGVDVAINNAGISIRHDFMDITPEEWRKVIGVDLDGVFYVAQQAARRMLAAGGGVIINMGSTSGMNGYPRYADYNCAKAGVIELTRTHGPGAGSHDSRHRRVPRLRLDVQCRKRSTRPK